MDDSSIFHAEIVATEMLNRIIEDVGVRVAENKIEKICVPYSVASVLTIIENALECKFLRHDPGETEWVEDKGPSLISADSWIRSAVPMRKKVRQPIKVDPPSPIKKKNTVKEEIFKVIPKPEPIPKTIEVNEQEEQLRKAKVQEILTKRQEIEEEKEKKKREEEAKKKIERENDDLKAKKWTFDAQGNVLIVHPPTKFPTAEIITQFKIAKEVRTQAKKLPTPQPTRVPETEKTFVKNIIETQSSVVESIKLTPGVTIKEGKNIRSSPPRGPTMSRAQYESFKRNSFIKTRSSKESKTERIDKTEKSSAEDNLNPFEDIPEYEHLPEVVENTPTKIPRSKVKKLLSQNRVTAHSEYIEGKSFLTPVDRFNLDIIHDKTWGINPPSKDPVVPMRFPKKVSERVSRERYTSRYSNPRSSSLRASRVLWDVQASFAKKPRDRKYIAIKAPSKSVMPRPIH